MSAPSPSISVSRLHLFAKTMLGGADLEIFNSYKQEVRALTWLVNKRLNDPGETDVNAEYFKDPINRERVRWDINLEYSGAPIDRDEVVDPEVEAWKKKMHAIEQAPRADHPDPEAFNVYDESGSW